MADLKQEYQQKDTFLDRWTTVIILIIFFLASWSRQFVRQLQVSKQNSAQHHQEFQMSEFGPEFWQSIFENGQSEWLQLATQTLIVAGFASYLFRKGDEEHYKTQLMIEELRQEIKKKGGSL